MIFFTSDLHLGHIGAIDFSHRPFSNIEMMNDVLIQNINETVEEKDDLWILGDFAYKLGKDEVRIMRNRIKCRHVHLVKGNHDKDYSGDDIFQSVQDYKELKTKYGRFILFHYPKSIEETMILNEKLKTLSYYKRNKEIQKRVKDRKKDITILFLRKTETIEESFVTIELKGGSLEQIRGKFNRIPDPEVYLFMEAYCAYKGITYDPSALITEDDDWSDEGSDAIVDYVYYYLNRDNVCNYDRTRKIGSFVDGVVEQYEQVSMYDLYPELMETNEIYENSLYKIFDSGMKDYHPKGELEIFIWDNMRGLFDKDETRRRLLQDSIIAILKRMSKSEKSFAKLWDISEAYNIPEVNFAILKNYRKNLTIDEIDMIGSLLLPETYDEIDKKWQDVR